MKTFLAIVMLLGGTTFLVRDSHSGKLFPNHVPGSYSAEVKLLSGPQPEELRDKIETYVSAFMDNFDFEGYVLAQHKGQLIISQSFSSGDIGFSDSTPFMIGSITKTFTAELIHKLGTKGILERSTPLPQLIPGIPISDDISIDHLLTHTAGVPDYYAISDFRKLQHAEMPLANFVHWISKYPLDFYPGNGNSYSNSGYNLLAYAVEELTQNSFSETLKLEILDSLNMRGSGSIEAGIPAHFPQGYEPGNGPSMLRQPQRIHATWLTGSGSMYSSPADLLTWCKVIKQRLENRLKDKRDWFPYGWGIRKRGAELFLEQNGRVPGFASNIRIYAKSNTIILILSRIESDAVNTMAGGIADILFGEDPEMPLPRKVQPVPAAQLSQYEGVYNIAPTFFVTVAIDDGGLGIATGTEAPLQFAVLDPIGKDKFFFRVGYTEVRFRKNRKGLITGLYWGDSGPYPMVQN